MEAPFYGSRNLAEQLRRKAGIAVSMDGKERWIDNVLIDRLSRSMKYLSAWLCNAPAPELPWHS
jgi:hypothetical protein